MQLKSCLGKKEECEQYMIVRNIDSMIRSNTPNCASIHDTLLPIPAIHHFNDLCMATAMK